MLQRPGGLAVHLSAEIEARPLMLGVDDGAPYPDEEGRGKDGKQFESINLPSAKGFCPFRSTNESKPGNSFLLALPPSSSILLLK